MSLPASVLPSRPPQPGQNPVPGGSRFLGGSRPEQGRGLFITFAMQKGLETLVSRPFRGGDKRDRTADLLNAIQALSQLSYTPIYWRRGAVTLNASDIIPNGSAFVNHKFLIFQKNFAGPLHFPDSRGGAPRETAPWPEKEEADR